LLEPIAIGAQCRALDDGDVDAANVSTTGGQLAAGEYKVLQDPNCVFGFRHLALVTTRTARAARGREVHRRVINVVNRRLTISVMIEMNRGVGVDSQDEALVAERFLTDVGVLGARSARGNRSIMLTKFLSNRRLTLRAAEAHFGIPSPPARGGRSHEWQR
jgi:hypothetical protein